MQLELLYRKVVLVYPPSGRGSLRSPVRARVDDGLDYMLKDDAPGAPIRAREWICHRIADRAGLPVVEHKPVLHSGRVLFGSRVVLHGGPWGTSFGMLGGGISVPEAPEVLSGIYAADLFLGNGDRHFDNLLLERDGSGALRIRVIDFSEAHALISPGHRTMMPAAGSNTVRCARELRRRYPFSATAADLALDRIAAIRTVEDVFQDMPPDWLDTNVRDDLCGWWSSPARKTHIEAIRSGLANGTLL